jgi:hypothetical protein
MGKGRFLKHRRVCAYPHQVPARVTDVFFSFLPFFVPNGTEKGRKLKAGFSAESDQVCSQPISTNLDVFCVNLDEEHIR